MRATLRPLLLVLSFAAACGSDADDPIVGLASVQVTHYDYDFDMETRQAQATLTLTLSSEGDCFTLPMRSEDLSGVLIDGEEARSAELVGNTVTVCGVGWPQNSTIEFASTSTVPLATDGDSQVGYSISTDIEGNPFTYLVSWVGGCDRFGPCDSAPSAFATYLFTIHHPEDQTVLCPGEITSSPGLTVCAFDYEGGPTYSSFGFAASPSWVEVDLGDWNGIKTTFYDMPTANLAGRLDVDLAKDFTAWMVDSFGPYPYGNELRFAAGPTYWNGFEHPGNIVLNERLNTGGLGEAYSNPLAHTTNHEIAHQWAGDQTTLADTYDFVWKEAMAEYLTYAHQAEFESPATALKTLSAWKSFSGFSQYYLVPDEKPALLDYYGDVYGPGPMILFRQLEAIFDRDTVLMGISSLLGSQHAISIDDVQRALEDATGSDLSTYFANWVHGEGAPVWPSFAVTTTVVDAGVELRVEQENPEAGLFGCAFDVALRGAGPDEVLIVRVNLGVDGMALFTETVEPAFAVASIGFDPQRECLGSKAAAAVAKQPYDAALDHPWVARQR